MAAWADVEIKIWDVRESGMIQRLLESASTAHGITMESPQWFAWKFRNSPWGPATVAYAQTSRGQVAGAVAFGAYRLNSRGAVLDAAISYETFVHPDFRRRGLFTSLLGAAETSARERNLSALINFPNAASRRGFLNAGWSDIGGIQTWIRPMSPVRSVRALVGIARRGRAFAPDEATTPLTSDRLEACVADRIPVGATSTNPNLLLRVHDPDFLNWRFCTSMANQYQVVESGEVSALVRLGSRGGHREAQILEVFSDGPGSSRHLRPLIRSIAGETGASFISVLATPGNPLTNRLPMLGFAPMPNSINFFIKPLDPSGSVEMSRHDLAITGVDVHTW